MEDYQLLQGLFTDNFAQNWGLAPFLIRQFSFRTINEANLLLNAVISHLNSSISALSGLIDLQFAWKDTEIVLKLVFHKGKCAEIGENYQNTAEIGQYRIGKELYRSNTLNYRVVVNESWSQSSEKAVIIKRCGPISGQNEANLHIQEGILQAIGHHSHICTLVDLFLTAQPTGYTVNLVSERCERDLEQDIAKRKHQFRPYTDSDYRSFLLSISSALTHLKSLNIAHRNLKPAAISLTSTGIYKLCNFSCAGKGQWTREGRGTPGYLSPEMEALIAGNTADQRVDIYASDVYSLGLVLLHMALLDVRSIDGDPRRMIEGLAVEEDLKLLLTGMLDPLPANRPLIDTIPFAASRYADFIVSTGMEDLISSDLLTSQERVLLTALQSFSPIAAKAAALATSPASASFYANAYYRAGALNIAEKWLLSRLEAETQAFHPENRYIHYRLSKVYVEMEEYDKALMHINKTLEVVRVLLGENNEKIAVVYTQLAKIWYKMGKYAEAENRCVQNLAILHELPYICPEGPGKAECIALLALISTNLGKNEAALTLATTALEAEWPEKHQIDTISSLLVLSNVHFVAKNYEIAYQIAQKSLEILQFLPKSHISLYFTALNQVSLISTELEEWEIAEEYTRKALEEGIRSGGAWEVGGVIARMSKIEGKLGIFSSAVKLGTQAVQILTESTLKVHIKEAIEAYCSLAASYSALNNPQKATESGQKALILTKTHFPQDFPLQELVRECLVVPGVFPISP